MPDREPRRISRRESFGALTILTVGIGILYYAIKSEKSVYLIPNTNQLPEMPPENLQPFVPSAEIGEQIDSETFKALTQELFDFATQVDAGKPYAKGKILQTDQMAWLRLIPFQREGEEQNELHLRWGYRSSAQLGTFILDPSAREIAIGRFEYGFGVPFLSLREFFTDPENFPKDFIENLEDSKVVNFTNNELPNFFWPAPTKITREASANEVQPVELSAHWLSAFLKQAIESFNARIPIQEKIPRIIPSRIA